jgi:hypothetical protein
MAHENGWTKASGRYEKLCRWMARTTQLSSKHLPSDYVALRDYLLQNGIAKHVPLGADESEPFILDTTFYGPTFESAVDTIAG